TLFLKIVACRPDAYPSLEEIRYQDCPEWDILIIMLERRNLLSGSHIKPIKKLHLPRICPPRIARVIQVLLQGKWPDRPSNRELSMAGNAEVIEDKTL
ncbi:hypothetical protein CPB86DRAFT_682461, partial [Serendipita vermifera]